LQAARIEQITVAVPSQKPQMASRPEEELSDSSQDNKKRKIQDDLDERLLPIFWKKQTNFIRS
jgi:hypothetical protein